MGRDSSVLAVEEPRDELLDLLTELPAAASQPVEPITAAPLLAFRSQQPAHIDVGTIAQSEAGANTRAALGNKMLVD